MKVRIMGSDALIQIQILHYLTTTSTHCLCRERKIRMTRGITRISIAYEDGTKAISIWHMPMLSIKETVLSLLSNLSYGNFAHDFHQYHRFDGLFPLTSKPLQAVDLFNTPKVYLTSHCCILLNNIVLFHHINDCSDSPLTPFWPTGNVMLLTWFIVRKDS